MTIPGVRRRRPSEETATGWLVVSPWIVGFLIFMVWPLGASMYFSLTKYDVVSSPKWVGLANYRQLLQHDPKFTKSIVNTLIYAGLFVPIHLVIALGVALLLNQARRMTGIFRTLYYLPSITPTIATAYIWILILNPNEGIVNRTLRYLHLPAPGWTVDPFWTKPTIVISQLWLVGSAMVIFLAGLKSVPSSLYEAATLDGAGSVRRFRDVTLPMLSGVTFFVLTVDLINSLQVFAQAYVMFDKNGGPSGAGLFAVMYLFKRAFEYFQMGYASAIAWLLFLMIVVVTLCQFWLAKRWVYVEADQ
jgi:multiple sugar transport system permease protein